MREFDEHPPVHTLEPSEEGIRRYGGGGGERESKLFSSRE
jgi:hypothetical protein